MLCFLTLDDLFGYYVVCGFGLFCVYGDFVTVWFWVVFGYLLALRYCCSFVI